MKYDKTNGSQKKFNSIKGWLSEHNDHENYPNIILECGTIKRKVFFSVSKTLYDKIKEELHIGKKYNVNFYLISKQKNNCWYTIASMLDIRPY